MTNRESGRAWCEILAMMLLGRIGQIDDIAGLALFGIVVMVGLLARRLSPMVAWS